MNNYEERKQRRIERYRVKAQKTRDAGDAALNQANRMASGIPFGQPILIGHHSEGRDRRYRERITNTFRKGYEALSKAEEYERRADVAENNDTISSDDPEALTKLKEKLTDLVCEREEIKAINQLLRKGISIEEIDTDNYMRRKYLSYQQFNPRKTSGFPPYVLQNLGANIRRVKERIAEMEKNIGKETKETYIGEVKIVENVEENRLQVFFPSKPSAEIRQGLRGNGFKWSRSNVCWQRQLNDSAKWAAEKVIRTLST